MDYIHHIITKHYAITSINDLSHATLDQSKQKIQ